MNKGRTVSSNTVQDRTWVSSGLVMGAAGLGVAISAHEAGSDVVVTGKSRRRDARTVLAAGGINAALGTVEPEGSWQQDLADTIEEGYRLSERGPSGRKTVRASGGRAV
jgi:succinate dehydrogenase / fumarate reductase flavoprotein subunit